MEFHAHPLELAWAILALLALGGTIHALYLSIADRAIARFADEHLQWPRGDTIVKVADLNLWSECFRFTLSLLGFMGALFALFSLPDETWQFSQYPQMLANIVVGIMSGLVLTVWSAFDVFVRRRIEIEHSMSVTSPHV